MSKPATGVAWGRIVSYALLALVLDEACANAQPPITCTFTSYSVAFGNYDPSQATATDGNGTVGVNCTHDNTGGATTTATVVLSIGAGTYGTFASRQMQISAGAQRLFYNLYIGSPSGQIWGDGSGGYNTSSISITGIAKNSSKTGSFTVFGRIPAQQNISAGNYADNVVISITP